MPYPEISRRKLLTYAVGLATGAAAKPLEVLAQGYSFLSIQEILRRYPDISPVITSVNHADIPNAVQGIYSGFHKFDPSESSFRRVSFEESKNSLEKNGVLKGLQEAIKRGQPVYLIIETPFPDPEDSKDADFKRQCSDWEEKIRQRAEFFAGNSAVFIIGNELNTPYSPWNGKLDIYLDLYLKAYKIIKSVNPQSRVFPWQEAYHGNGSLLETFLEKLKKKGGTIDGLPVNFYDISSKMKGRVEEYRTLLNRNSLRNAPLVISELCMPEGSEPSETEKASFVAQHLATLAYLQKSIPLLSLERAAWFAGFIYPNHRQDFALTTSGILGNFIMYPAFTAFVLCQHLLANPEQITFQKKDSGMVIITPYEKGEPRASFVWNESKTPLFLTFEKPFRQIVSPIGKILSPNSPVKLLPPKTELSAGETIIILY